MLKNRISKTSKTTLCNIVGKKREVKIFFTFSKTITLKRFWQLPPPNKWPNLSLIVKKSDIIAYWKKSIRTIQYNSSSILIEKKKSYGKQNQTTKQKQNVKHSTSQLVQIPQISKDYEKQIEKQGELS